mmetsp:Transcript_51994/g.105936  ORF Transcript_51994/g.105936 Transcript_51994/m.105936 type:complete len:233 (+) Transcript_51994:433-1131(+)
MVLMETSLPVVNQKYARRATQQQHALLAFQKLPLATRQSWNIRFFRLKVRMVSLCMSDFEFLFQILSHILLRQHEALFSPTAILVDSATEQDCAQSISCGYRLASMKLALLLWTVLCSVIRRKPFALTTFNAKECSHSDQTRSISSKSHCSPRLSIRFLLCLTSRYPIEVGDPRRWSQRMITKSTTKGTSCQCRFSPTGDSASLSSHRWCRGHRRSRRSCLAAGLAYSMDFR